MSAHRQVKRTMRVKNKSQTVSRRGRARRKPLVAPSLTTASCSLGTPTLGQRHHFETKGIDVSPLAEPAANDSVHRLKASGIGARQPKRGRSTVFKPRQANELRAALEVELRRKPEFPKLPLQRISISFVENQIRLKDEKLPSRITIGRQIVSPAYRKVRPKRPK